MSIAFLIDIDIEHPPPPPPSPILLIKKNPIFLGEGASVHRLSKLT